MKQSLQLFFSHHPLCDKFENHVIKVFKLRICRGCFFFYAGVSIMLPFLFFLTQVQVFIENYDLVFFFLIIILTLPTVILSFVEVKYQIIKDLGRLILGFDAVLSFLYLFSTEYSVTIVLLSLYMVSGVVFFNFLRIRRNSAICQACDTKEIRDYCGKIAETEV